MPNSWNVTSQQTFVANPGPGLNFLKQLGIMVSHGVYDDSMIHLAVTNYPTSAINAVMPPGTTWQMCSGCKHWMFSKNMHRAYGGKQYVCAKCKDSWYMPCAACESLILKDDNIMHVHASELQSFMQFNQLAHYKTNPVESKKAQFLHLDTEPRTERMRYFGVEVEIEKQRDRPLPPDLIAKSVASFPKGTVIAKTDGSLSVDPNHPKNGSNGWELCSMPATLAYHHWEGSGWWKFFAATKPFVQHRPDTTGLHFHVNLESIEPLALGKLSAWINSECNRELLTAVADRDFNIPSPTPPYKTYAKAISISDPETLRHQLKQVHSMKAHNKDCPYHPSRVTTRMYYYDKRLNFVIDRHRHPIIIRIEDDPLLNYRCRCKGGMYHFKDHYAALNLKTQKDTFEFRLFRFSMNEQHFFASMEFVDAIIDFCTQASIRDLTATEFLRWYEASRRRMYINLTQWLVDRNFLASRKRRD